MKRKNIGWFRAFVLLCAGLAACSVSAVDPVTGVGGGQAAIVNGSSVPIGLYPWMAALFLKSNSSTRTITQRQFCGGSLIAPTWVLTAAHCVVSASADSFQVLLGREDLDGNGGQVLDVSEVVSNPRYDSNFLTNDIALIRLATPATVTPVALATAADAGKFVNQTVIPLGWGSTTGIKDPACKLVFFGGDPTNKADYSCTSVTYSKQGSIRLLQLSQLTVLSNSACYSNYVGFLNQYGYKVPADLTVNNVVGPGRLCLIDSSGGSSPCYGDSGGPLLATLSNAKKLLIGITSFGLEEKCVGKYGLAFFTEIARFSDFISQTMAGSKELAFKEFCPITATPVLAVKPLIDGSAQVNLTWEAVAGATGYTLWFTPVPRQEGYVGRQTLSADIPAVNVSLPSGSRYMVALQVRGKECDSSLSATVEVKVP